MIFLKIDLVTVIVYLGAYINLWHYLSRFLPNLGEIRYGKFARDAFG